MLKVLGIVATLLAALGCGVLALMAGLALVPASGTIGPYLAAERAACLILRAAEEKKLVTAAERADWARNATAGEAVDKGDGAYYRSDCTLSRTDFDKRRG